MSKLSTQNGVKHKSDEIMTLTEVAKYLRTDEKDVLTLIQKDEFPARMVGNEYRFLKQAINDWLSVQPQKPQAGTKEAILKQFGVFQDENADEFLTTIRNIRKVAE